MTTATAFYEPAGIWGRRSPAGVSEAANTLNSLMVVADSELRQAETWNHNGPTLDELEQTFSECSEGDWDGYDALPMNAAAYEEAVDIIRSLPRGFPLPSIVPEPDGSVGFEWSKGADRVFVVSVSGKGLIVYAGVLGKVSTTHGTELFDETIPAEIKEKILRVYA